MTQALQHGETVSALTEAALAYGAAWEAYSAAYDRWRQAHPDEAKLDDHLALASWEAEVRPLCQAVNVANNRLCNIAVRLHKEATE